MSPGGSPPHPAGLGEGSPAAAQDRKQALAFPAHPQPRARGSASVFLVASPTSLRKTLLCYSRQFSAALGLFPPPPPPTGSLRPPRSAPGPPLLPSRSACPPWRCCSSRHWRLPQEVTQSWALEGGQQQAARREGVVCPAQAVGGGHRLQGCGVLGEPSRVRAKVPEMLPFCYNQPLFLQEVPSTRPAGAGHVQVGKGQRHSPGDRWGGWGAGRVWRQDGQVIRAEGPLPPAPPPPPFSLKSVNLDLENLRSREGSFLGSS